MVSEQQPTPAEALIELRDILHSAAAERPSDRLTVIRYTLCRDVLLRSELRSVMPGFLLQCLTFARFHDFIHLYHPQVEKRVAFIDSELLVSSEHVRTKPRFDIFDDPAF